MSIQGINTADSAKTEIHQNISRVVQFSVAQQLSDVLETIIRQAASKARTATAPRVEMVLQAAHFPAHPLNDPRNHFLATYLLLDNTIELEDGSLWRVNSWDMPKILNWANNDILSLTVNDPFIFGEEYKLTNTYTDEVIHLDLIDGPLLFGPASHWIVAIDRMIGRIYLENGSYWDISVFDRNKLSNWAVNDTIIFGDSKNWWNDSFLINVNMNQTAQASKGL
ncbi:MAG: hypothetical protein JSS32_05100 [Verrucomicrobia bacterium]|nr:hypothetical protein [Verrucomicrobiota bacterium]